MNQSHRPGVVCGNTGVCSHKLLAVGALALISAAVQARPAPAPITDPARWAIITNPGNAPHQWQSGSVHRSTGDVDYEYRISKTETTVGEWFEFVKACAPFLPFNLRTDPSFYGTYIHASLPGDGSVRYTMEAGAKNMAASTGWRYAARYCNWLTNDKANAAWAFESGAYDTSTFTINDDGSYNDQLVRSAGAKYWIPSESEWVKATYFDPNRYGPNLEGYWMFEYKSDSPPISGPPGIGQTNADLVFPWPVEIGSYPNAVTPWGLMDVSGGLREWLEDSFSGEGFMYRGLRGSQAGDPLDWYDPLETYQNASSVRFGNGVRIAGVVPSPGSISAFAPLVFICLRRRRTSAGTHRFLSQTK